MESDDDSSSDDSVSSSGSSDNSSSQEEDHLEPARILGNTFELPQDLCENPEIFKEFLSQSTWDSLSEANVRHMKKFLPKFAENDEEEKETTVKKLFDRETFCFSSPLVEFHKKLRDGAFRPDIARMQSVLQKAKKQHVKHQWRQEIYQTMQEIILSRERLLFVAKGLPPGLQPRVAPPAPSLFPPAPPQPVLQYRTRKRYFQELAAIRSEVCGEGGVISDDENFPEGPPVPPSKNQKRNSLAIQTSDTNGVVSTLGPSRNTGPNMSEEWRRRALAAHKRRRQINPEHPELMTAGITLDSIRARCGTFIANGSDAQVTTTKAPPKRQRRPPAPPKRVPASPTDSNSDIDPTSLHIATNFNTDFIKTEPGTVKSRLKHSPSPPPLIQQQQTLPPTSLPPPPPPVVSPVTVKVENPVVEESIIPEDSSVELVQETHVCFFSVLRDLLCGTTRQCLPLLAITAGLRKWRQNPIAPLNHWYSAVDDWVKALPSAVAYLAGETANLPEDFVPFLQYKPANQVYQWIGAGRDTDNNLQQLCTQWLNYRKAVTNPPIVVGTSGSTIGTGGSSVAASHTMQLLDRPPSPPMTKWNAKWQASSTELESFRMQERIRFQRPHKAFTYRLPRGNSIVGPLRGVYACDENDGKRGARGHSLLAPNRPRHVTLLALVRDAVACLPGGEGTRAHITALLRRSQYLVPEAPEQALQAAVSGALDRMHGAPDPCVRYLPMQKVWQYLHRERTEEEFERLHAENQNKGKAGAVGSASGSGSQSKRPSNAKPRVRPSKAKQPTPLPTSSTPPAMIKTTTNTSLESDGDGEDANVDVEGTDAIPDIRTPVVIKVENAKHPKPEPVKQESIGRKGLANRPETIRHEFINKQEPGNRLDMIGRHEIVITSNEPIYKPEFIARQETVTSVKHEVTQPTIKQHEPVKLAEKPLIQSRQEFVNKQQESMSRAEAIIRQDKLTRPDIVARNVEVISRQSDLPPKLDIVKNERAGTPTKPLTQQSIIIQTSSQAPTSLLQSDKIFSVANTISSSILQPRSTVVATSVVRQALASGGGRSVVRVVNPTTSGKSLISPQALKPSTPPPSIVRAATTQAKVIVQRPGQGQTTAHQRAVLESLIQQQRSGQSDHQVFHTIQPTQKVITSTGASNQIASPAKTQSSTIGQTIQLAGQTVQLPSGQTVQLSGQTVQLTGQTVQLAGQTVQLNGQTVQLAGQTVQLGSGQTVQTVQLGSGQTMQLGTGQTVQLGTGQTVQLGGGQTMQLGNGQTVQLSGQTVQLANGQTVHLGSGQTVQLSNGQTVQLSSGQTVQLGGGQAMQLGGGQTVQITGGQTVVRPGGDVTLRGNPQRQTTPLVAKILTNAQVRGGNIMQGARMGTPGTQGTLRVAGLSLAQLQGKPVLLHTSSSGAGNSNLILQTSGGTISGQNIITAAGSASGSGDNVQGNQQRTIPTTSAPQHTLLLSNIVPSRGQVVRVASGGSHILGPTLRLQTAAPNAQLQARPGATNVVLGGQALKLQASPIRLHQGATSATIAGQGTNRVLLASGTRLHGLKLLPVQHALARGGGLAGRQVYARIVGPGAGAGTQATIVRAAAPTVITTQPSNTTPQQRHPQ